MGNEQKKAVARLEWLFDGGEFTEIANGLLEGDAPAGVITAFGKINGSPAYAFSQDADIKSGSVGKAHAEKICRLYELAAKTGAPVIAIHDSNGAQLAHAQETLSAYGRILRRSANVSGVIPQISVIAGVCAGSAAMIAASSDITIMTKDSELFLTPNTPSDAKNAAKSGTADIICENDEQAVLAARRLAMLLPANNISAPARTEYEENTNAVGINAVVDKGSAIMLGAGYGANADTALATICGRTIGIASASNGRTMSCEDCSKLARFIRMCDAYSIPVISFVDTVGFEDTGDAVRNCARLANAYADATTVKLTVITGMAIGSAYIALAGKNTGSDFTFAFPDAIIAPMLPEAAVEFLHHDMLKGANDVNAERKRLAAEYASSEASAQKAAYAGCIDGIIRPDEVRAKISSSLDILAGKRVSGLPRKHTARA